MYSLFRTTTPCKHFNCFLLFVCYLFFSSIAYGQQNILQKPVSLHLSQTKLLNAVLAIEKAANCSIIYSETFVDSGRLVSLDVDNTPLSEVLQRVFGDLARGMQVRGNQISIQPSKGKGTVSGTVQTSDGQPAAYVTVGIKGQRSVQADAQGRFTLTNIEAGQHIITASFVGLQTQRQNIQVSADDAVNVQFILTEDAQTLQEVVVNGERVNKFANKETDDVARMPLKNLENPQVYNTVTSDLMRERTITNYSEIYYNVPGITPPSVTYSNGHEYFIRGFYNGGEFKDGMAFNTGETEDPQNLERVDVLKGPSATLFGAAFATFGGVINNVSKQPFEYTKGEIGYSVGSWGLSRLTLDYNTPLNSDSTLLFRINAARHWENTFQDYGFRHTYDIAPALSYKVNDRLTLRFNGEFYNQNSTMWQWTYFGPGVTIKDIRDLKTPYNRSFAGDQMLQNWSNSRILAQAEYKISEHWQSATKFAQGYYHRPESYYMNGNEYVTDSTMARFIMGAKPQLGTTTEIQQNFTGDFQIGSMHNRMLIGLDVLSQKYASSFIGNYVDTVLMSDPSSVINVSEEQIKSAFTRVPGENHYVSQYYDYSAYVSDILNITDRFLAMASLRFDRYDTKNSVNNGIEQTDGYRQNALSPKFGLVYQVVKNQVSLFANYMNGFSNNAPQTDGTRIATYKPSQANQWEGGVKMNVLSDKLAATLSYYNIDVKNALRSLPSSQVSIQDGSQKSKGFEAELIANPVTGLNIMAGYGYNDAKYLKGDDGLATLSLGSPKHIANFYASYKFMNGKIKGIGLNFGANHVGASDYNFPVMIPSYTIYNASVMYDRPKYNISFKVNNLTDEQYWSWNFIQPQPPRNFVASMSYKF